MNSIWFAWIGLICGVALLGGCKKESRQLEPPRAYDKVRDRLLNTGELRHYPSIDPTGRWMVFARNNRTGLEYVLMDLSSLSVTTIVAHAQVNYEELVAELYAWSTDGKWLALAEPDEIGSAWTVKMRNMTTGVTEVTGIKQEFQDFLWLDGDRLAIRAGDALLMLERLKEEWKPNYRKRFSLTKGANKGFSSTNSNTLRPQTVGWKTLTGFESNRLAYAFQGNLWEIDCQSGTVQQLTDWQPQAIKWLDYSESRRAFLFSTPDSNKSKGYALMRWQLDSGAGNRPLQLSSPEMSAMKGRWLNHGYAYVAQDEDQSALMIISENGFTNLLFEGGDVWSYEVNATGNTLAAIASQAREPMGIWRVLETGMKHDQLLVGGAREESFSLPRVDQNTATNQTGDPVKYTVFLPAQMDTSRKYPAVVMANRGRLWENMSQVLPEVGIIQVMLHLGKGSDRLKFVNDMEVLLKEIPQLYPVDPKRIYLEAISDGTSALADIIEAYPDAFRGVVFDNPVAGAMPSAELLRLSRIELLTTMGTLDPSYTEVRRHMVTLQEAGLPVWFVEINNLGHTTGNSVQLEQRYRAMVSFIHRSAPAEP